MLPRKWSVLARIGLITIAATALAAGPASARLRVFAHWNVAISGSVRHDWTLPDSTPCQATGSGSVTARFASVRPGRITIANNGFGLGDFSWDGRFHVRGTISGVDARTRNPPPPDGSSCFDDPSEPVPDTRACGTRTLNDGLSVEAPLRGLRRGYALGDNGNFSNALTPPDGVANCELGGFISFAYILHGGSTSAQELKLPGYPSAAKLRSHHGKIVVNAFQRRRFIPTAETTRRVRLVFTRVR